MPTQQPASAAITIDESTCDELIKVLGKTLDLKDNDTAGHSGRVRRYSEEIARALGCSTDEVKKIARAASLHDIGKIAIPDAILRKQGRLSPDESRVMETHAWVGFSLLRHISSLRDVAEIVLSHHEHFDGKGYPQRLKGDEIPLGARIFAVCDTLDAMTSDRPYRRALPFSDARAEILSESGRQFDPKVVKAFLSIREAVFLQIMLDEKRRAARVPFHAIVNCVKDGRQYRLKAVNLSQGGLLLEKDRGMPLGKEIGVEFELPHVARRLKLKAEVIRRELRGRTAIAFKSPHPRDKVILLQYIARLVETQYGALVQQNSTSPMVCYTEPRSNPTRRTGTSSETSRNSSRAGAFWYPRRGAGTPSSRRTE
jgi:putative nucleotidyltransferase with HDIG domain